MNEQLVLTAEPRARHDNPTTSHEAAKSMAKGSKALEDRIGRFVANVRDPVTAEEIGLSMTQDPHCPWGFSSIVTAVPRARRRGLIVPAGEGLTRRGRRAITYRSAP
jgi:hypothetical protein